MAKNIIIEKDGLLTAFSASKIRTRDPDEGYKYWIPLDETQLAEKNINENGTYVAAAGGFYGYGRVVVDVDEGGIVGTAADGNDYYVVVDENHAFVFNLMPSAMTIDTMPTKRSYTQGETVDLTGMVVKAYDGNGAIWEDANYQDGIIPLEEIDYTPKKATSTSVTIKWNRPHDHKELQATFSITIS